MPGLGAGMGLKRGRTAITTPWETQYLSPGKTLSSRAALAVWRTRDQGAHVMKNMNRPACLLGVLVLSVLACTKACGDSDEADDSFEPTYFSDSHREGPKHPTPLEIMEAKCTWPCNAPGCVRAPGGSVCQVRCEKDADCPAGSVCVCEADGCSWGTGKFVDEWPFTAENSCIQLLPPDVDALKECRREKNCTKHPGAGPPRP